MKKLALLLSLLISGSVLYAEKNEVEILKEEHTKKLKEVIPHLGDMWNETTTIESNGINYTYQNGLGTSNTTHTTTRTVYNTPEAGRAHNLYKKSLEPFLNKILYKDMGTSISTGVLSGLFVLYQLNKSNKEKSQDINHLGKTVSIGLLLPILQVIFSNLNEEEMKYLNDRTLTVHDNLYKNWSWYTAERVVGSATISVLSGITTGLLGIFIAELNSIIKLKGAKL